MPLYPLTLARVTTEEVSGLSESLLRLGLEKKEGVVAGEARLISAVDDWCDCVPVLVFHVEVGGVAEPDSDHVVGYGVVYE